MRSRWSRRNGYLSATALIVLVLGWCLQIYGYGLGDSQWLSGWILVAVICLLMMYNGRKKITFLPAIRNRTWLQLHLYVGLAAIFLFLMHIQWRWPDGYLEFSLALLFVLICASGIVGIFISRLFARRLTHQGEQLIFERIPAFARTLRESADDVVKESVDATESTTLADFYVRSVAPFIGRPSFSPGYLFNDQRGYYRLANELAAQKRYMNDKEKEFTEELLDLLKQKNALDNQYTLQLTLKSWLFIHIPLTYSMVLVLLAHMLLVYGFGSV
jgi:hypothetical protein